MIFEWDDLGCNHVISDMCRSHDCRDRLLQLKAINPAFKCTLFAIPAEMTLEMLEWCANRDWIELAVHGYDHNSNYECKEWSYGRAEEVLGNTFVDIYPWQSIIQKYFVKGFRAPGWQISDDLLKWLYANDWWVADQGYNDDRRPKDAKAYVNYNGNFEIHRPNAESKSVAAYHGHVWDVGEKGNVPNGIYEDAERVDQLVRITTDFNFISEYFK